MSISISTHLAISFLRYEGFEDLDDGGASVLSSCLVSVFEQPGPEAREVIMARGGAATSGILAPAAQYEPIPQKQRYI